MDALTNTDSSGGTRYSEGKGPLVGAPLFGLYPGDLWEAYCRWALDPRNASFQDRFVLALLLEAQAWKLTPAQEVGRLARAGAAKYALFDWAQGQLLSTLVNSCGRHLEKHYILCEQEPVPRDEETGAPHIIASLWNLLCWTSLEDLEQGDRLDDYTHLLGKNTAEVKAAGCCGVGCLECPFKEAPNG